MIISVPEENQERTEEMKKDIFPPGWDDQRVHSVLSHYASQSEEEAVAEDEAVYEDSEQTFMEIPNELKIGRAHV